MTRQLPALTVDECIELRAFAAERGRKWKAELQAESWWRGIPMRGYPTLYGLRNSHGPEWLEAFDLGSIALGKE